MHFKVATQVVMSTDPNLRLQTDTYTDAQLGYAYASAANNNMKVFISFDFNW